MEQGIPHTCMTRCSVVGWMYLAYHDEVGIPFYRYVLFTFKSLQANNRCSVLTMIGFIGRCADGSQQEEIADVSQIGSKCCVCVCVKITADSQSWFFFYNTISPREKQHARISRNNANTIHVARMMSQNCQVTRITHERAKPVRSHIHQLGPRNSHGSFVTFSSLCWFLSVRRSAKK